METVKTSFTEEMHSRLRDMEVRAKAVGSNMTQVTKNTGVARATYERWMQRAPQSVSKLDVMEAEVRRLEDEHRQKAEAGAAEIAASH